MNVFDFDKTIYLRESTTTFYRFCIPRHPLILLWLPVAGIFGLFQLLGLCDTTRWKEAFHGYLRLVPDAEDLVKAFWDRERVHVAPWVADKLPQGGLVISASPEFLIGEMCRRLGLDFMGTRMDIRSGRIAGRNCRGAEKPVRFRERYPDAVIAEFYSDSLADSPMAVLAENAYMAAGGVLRPWPELK
jgi:phosphoserine phosphatase